MEGERSTSVARERTNGAPGLWIGAAATFLVASLAMVQIRSKIFGGFPSGDWPRDGYTWHFLPALVLCVAVWVVAAHLWSRRRRGTGLREGMERLGVAAAPLLGLVITWSWYGLTGPQFHRGAGLHDARPVSRRDAGVGGDLVGAVDGVGGAEDLEDLGTCAPGTLDA